MALVKWPTRIAIVRHGLSEQNVVLDLLEEGLEELLKRQKTIRDADIQLTPLGLWQGECTGQFLSKTPRFDICLSSPYTRAVQTADAIISRLGYPLMVFKDNRLREKEFGRLHGFTTEEIRKQYPEEFQDRERDGRYWYRLPRGENYPDVETRVHGILDKLVRDYAGASVLIVTHQVPYVMFRALFDHLDEAQVLALGGVPNCGIQEYLIDTSQVPEGRMKLATYNQLAYDMEPWASIASH